MAIGCDDTENLWGGGGKGEFGLSNCCIASGGASNSVTVWVNFGPFREYERLKFMVWQDQSSQASPINLCPSKAAAEANKW